MLNVLILLLYVACFIIILFRDAVLSPSLSECFLLMLFHPPSSCDAKSLMFLYLLMLAVFSNKSANHNWSHLPQTICERTEICPQCSNHQKTDFPAYPTQVNAMVDGLACNTETATFSYEHETSRAFRDNSWLRPQDGNTVAVKDESKQARNFVTALCEMKGERSLYFGKI